MRETSDLDRGERKCNFMRLNLPREYYAPQRRDAPEVIFWRTVMLIPVAVDALLGAGKALSAVH